MVSPNFDRNRTHVIQHVKFLCWYVWCSSFFMFFQYFSHWLNVDQHGFTSSPINCLKQVSHLTPNNLQRLKNEPCSGIYSNMGVPRWFRHLRNINLSINGRIKDGSATHVDQYWSWRLWKRFCLLLSNNNNSNMNESIAMILDVPKHPKHPTSQRWRPLDSSTSQWQVVHYVPAHVQLFCLKNPSTAVNQKRDLWWSQHKHQEN